MSETGNRIWRPSVEPTENPLPFPSPSNQRKLYTKTSLIANRDDQSTSHNRAVLSASQSYNSSPRPFQRQEHSVAESSVNSNNLQSVTFSNQTTWTPKKLQLQQQVDSSRESGSCSRKVNVLKQVDPGRGRAESMSPKLVHKQYNSPLDLYSMNNIRKTIEAHTELIAPGVKGINFMKADTPINKQSEVYRLVKEEEEQRSHQANVCLSPISGQPLKLPTGLQSNETVGHSQEQAFRQTKQQQQQQQRSATTTTSTSECSWANNRQQATASGSAGRSACPVCCECGQSIVGPFAKIQNRFVHPHCFNCTTCGTSLKNTGYFTIEEKLYCEIHAKQVANMMRIPFNFGTNPPQVQAASATLNKTERSQHSEQSAKSGIESCEQHSIASNYRCGSEAKGAQVLSPRQAGAVRPLTTFGSPATISTMFANRSQSQDVAERRDQKFPRTASVNEMAGSPAQQAGQVEANLLQFGSLSHRQCGGQQTMVSSNTTQDRRFIQETCQIGVGGRLPICVNCNAQIHGPYILASQTTWCKHCSQNHFNCSSCNRSLLDIGFIEDGSNRYYCEHCYEAYCAPVCSRCNIKIKGDCLNALNKKWHPSCFTCGHCRRPFGNSSFYLEDNNPYCERDWKALFTTKCYSCSYPIEAGDKWIEALDRNYHSNCFRCTSCQANLEGSTFYRKGDKPYCRLHAR